MKDGNSNEEGFNLTSSLKGVVDKIFKLEAGEEDEELECCFKVLIFDDYVFNIICPLLKVCFINKDSYTPSGNTISHCT